jgi:hypothetical protein
MIEKVCTFSFYKWQMSFNAKKCQVIRITPKNRPPLPTTYKLHGRFVSDDLTISGMSLM